MSKINLLLFSILFMTVLAVQAQAANDSMDVDDIINVKPSIPFGGDFFAMIFSAIKWAAVACFIIGLFATIAHGSIATVVDNAEMSERSQKKLFTLIKIMLLGGFVFLAGIFIFETYL